MGNSNGSRRSNIVLVIFVLNNHLSANWTHHGDMASMRESAHCHSTYNTHSSWAVFSLNIYYQYH